MTTPGPGGEECMGVHKSNRKTPSQVCGVEDSVEVGGGATRMLDLGRDVELSLTNMVRRLRRHEMESVSSTGKVEEERPETMCWGFGVLYGSNMLDLDAHSSSTGGVCSSSADDASVPSTDKLKDQGSGDTQSLPPWRGKGRG
ncbi:hypothetical protein Dimus_036755 [Dionaea muscipula]